MGWGGHAIVSAAVRTESPWPGTNKSQPPRDGDMKGEEGWREGNYWNSR